MKIFLIYKEIQMGAAAKSYMRKGFLIYEEMRTYLVTYEEPVSHIWLCNCSLLYFLIYKENFVFFFISAPSKKLLISWHWPYNCFACSPHTVLRLSSASTTSPWAGGACLPPAAAGWRSLSGSGMGNLNKFLCTEVFHYSPYSFLMISAYVAHFVFWDMSGFVSRELHSNLARYQLATHLPT